MQQSPTHSTTAGMSRRSVFALHTGYWMAYAALLLAMLTVVQVNIRSSASSPSALARWLFLPLTVPNVLAFYASQALLFPLVRRRRPRRIVVGFAVLICVVAALFAFAMLYLGAGSPPLPLVQLPSFAGLVLCLFLAAAAHATMGLGLRGFVAWYGDLRDREERERHAHALELALIRSRLDPHFLFNTLNNIDVLIERKPAMASAYLQKLSELMRYVLFEATTRWVPLSTELAHMARYMEIEALRHADPQYAALEVEGDAAGLLVPPTLFMPFIENAFTHAARDDGARIHVRCEIADRKLTFTCVNRCRPDVDGVERFGGLGHALVQRRLELLYPRRHALELERSGDKFSVSLTIDTHDDSLPDR